MTWQDIPFSFLPMHLFAAFLLVLCFAWPASLQADTPMQKEAQVIGNLLKYIRGIASENIIVVYDSAVPSTLREAESIAATLSSKEKRKTFVVSIEALAQSQNAGLAIITNGMESHFNTIAAQAKRTRLFTISLDNACTQQNSCVLSIETSSGIEIFLNEDLLRSLGFDVDAALRFMVKRV